MPCNRCRTSLKSCSVNRHLRPNAFLTIAVIGGRPTQERYKNRTALFSIYIYMPSGATSRDLGRLNRWKLYENIWPTARRLAVEVYYIIYIYYILYIFDVYSAVLTFRFPILLRWARAQRSIPIFWMYSVLAGLRIDPVPLYTRFSQGGRRRSS